MNKFVTALTITTALVAGGTLMNGRAEAVPLGAPDAMRAAAGQVDAIQNVQVFYWHGRRYCWYDDAWNGPGWYWCGYAWRRGIGWGGGSGWHGWTIRGHREFRRHERFEDRRDREFRRDEPFEDRRGREFREFRGERRGSTPSGGTHVEGGTKGGVGPSGKSGASIGGGGGGGPGSSGPKGGGDGGHPGGGVPGGKNQ